MTNVNLYISVSGVHGIGKSSIVDMLCRKNKWLQILETPDQTIKPLEIGPSAKNPIIGELWHLRQIIFREKSLRMPGIKVADRTAQDCLVYAKAFEKEEKINHDTYKIFEDIVRAVHLTDPDMEIVLWADIDKIKERIAGRESKYNMDGWGEDDLTHLRLVNDGFKEYYEDFRDVRPLVFFDTTNDIPEKTFNRVMDRINKKKAGDRKIDTQAPLSGYFRNNKRPAGTPLIADKNSLINDFNEQVALSCIETKKEQQVNL